MPNDFGRSKRNQGQDLATSYAADQLHQHDDADASAASHHHTLGSGNTQAAPGSLVDDVKALQSASFVGEIKMWPVAAMPNANWLLCDGSAIPVGFTQLIALIGPTLPDYRDRAPVGASGTKALLSAGGAATVTLAVANLPGHTHGVGTLVAANESAHTHGIGSYTAAGEAAHTHGVGTYATATEAAHKHITPFATLVNTTTGGAAVRVVDINGFLGGGTAQTGALGGVGTAHNHGMTGSSAAGSSHTHTLSGSSAAGSAHTHTLSGSTDAGAGTATAISVVDPYRAINFIIRAA